LKYGLGKYSVTFLMTSMYSLHSLIVWFDLQFMLLFFKNSAIMDISCNETFSIQRTIAYQARLSSSNSGNSRYCSCSATYTTVSNVL